MSDSTTWYQVQAEVANPKGWCDVGLPCATAKFARKHRLVDAKSVRPDRRYRILKIIERPIYTEESNGLNADIDGRQDVRS